MSRKFRFEWRITLLAFVLSPLMVGLGFWQLDRADQNRALILQAKQRRQETPVSLQSVLLSANGNTAQADWQKTVHLQQVMLQGVWLDKCFLLENQSHDGHNGYNIIGVMRLDKVGNVLVNRGWIQAPALRSELPVVPATTSADEVGEVYVASSLMRDEPLFAEDGWPKRIGRINIPGAAHLLGIDLLPLTVRLREGSPSALVTQWPVVNIQPEKNVAYAIQWFAMSFALLVCYMFFLFRAEPVSQ